MSKLAGIAGGQALGVASVAAAGITATGLYVAGVFSPEPEVITPVTQTVPETAIEAPEPETAVTITEETAAAPEVVETAPAVILPDPPSIGLFRLETDGMMLVAGNAEQGWTVSIVMDETRIAEAQAGENNEFIQFVNINPSDQPRVLSLVMISPETGEEIPSKDQVIIAPTPTAVVETRPAQPDDDSTVAIASLPDSTIETVENNVTITEAPDAVAEIDTTAAVEVSEIEMAAAQEEAVETQIENIPGVEDVVSQTVLLSNEEGVTVLQKPDGGAGPEVMSTVALDAISYSNEGEVQLAGRGIREGFVRVYLDNTPITTSRIAQDGVWRTELPEVDTGVYTLRIDQVDTEGNVTGRVETPFKREDEEIVASAEAAAGAEAAVRAITVQPGNTLWAISRDTYGEGTLYVRVFEANAEHIRNPDLIYPGQVFTLPEQP